MLWAELRWAAREEGVVHLEDLMLRRVRIGLLLPEGGSPFLSRIRSICQPELGWDDARWQAEEAAYLALWHQCYSLPRRNSVPDWKALLLQARQDKATTRSRPSRPKNRRKQGFLLGLISLLLTLLFIRSRWQIRKH